MFLRSTNPSVVIFLIKGVFLEMAAGNMQLLNFWFMAAAILEAILNISKCPMMLAGHHLF